MDKIEELLPDLDNFMRNILSKENISIFAEKRRKYYVERLDVIKFDRPNLPPRPDGGLMKFPTGGSTESTPINGSPMTACNNRMPGHTTDITFKNNAKNDRQSVVSEENIYADMDDSPLGTPNETEDLYLVPEETLQKPDQTHKSWSDSESGTSYESYGEEDDLEDRSYMNIGDEDHGPSDDVPLPKIAKKKRKKKKVGEDLPISVLPNVTFQGDLHHKGSWSWTKRYCVISDNRMVVYKAERDARPILQFVLLGYDVAYVEKEGRRNHVIRVSHPGCETHFFAADLREIANLWISHLSTPALNSEGPSSGDSVKLPISSKNSTASSMSIQHSTSASNLSGSSEGGSGDGVVTMETKGQKPSDEKKQQAADRKKKNIFAIIGTSFSKKKGQKMKRQIIIGDIPMDPQAVISGILDVFHEKRTKSEWCTKFCMVKNGQLECFHDNLADGVEFSLPLAGVDIENAGKETKKELSIRLLLKNGEQIILDTSDIIEQGKWLHVLIKCRESKFDQDPSVLYENQDVEVYKSIQGNDDIYDEVDHTKMLKDKNSVIQTGSFGNAVPTVSNSIKRKSSGASDLTISHPIQRNSSGASDLTISHPIQRNSSGGSDLTISHPIQRNSSGASDCSSASANPPPLPQSDPPKRPLPSKVIKSRPSMDEGNDLDLSEQMACAFPQMKSHIDLGSRSKIKDKDNLVKVTQSAKITDVEATVGANTDDGVVKCHIGPTIAEDKELLQKTQNPVLNELRKEKTQGSLDTKTLMSQINQMRSKIISMKKQRSDLRSKLLTARLSREKQQFEVELHDLDQVIDESEQTFNKLQLLAQQRDTNLSRNGSFQSTGSGGSNSSSRSNSFKHPSECPPKPPVTSSQKAKTMRTSPITTTGTQPHLKIPVKSSVSKLDASTKTSRPTCTSARSVTKPTAVHVAAKQVTKTSTSSVSCKTTASRFNASSNSASQNKAAVNSRKTTVTSPSKESLKVGQTRIRTVHTTTTTTASSGPTRSQKSSTQVTTAKSSETNSSTRKGVKECLKLWEAMSEDSTC